MAYEWLVTENSMAITEVGKKQKLGSTHSTHANWHSGVQHALQQWNGESAGT